MYYVYVLHITFCAFASAVPLPGMLSDSTSHWVQFYLPILQRLAQAPMFTKPLAFLPGIGRSHIIGTSIAPNPCFLFPLFCYKSLEIDRAIFYSFPISSP